MSETIIQTGPQCTCKTAVEYDSETDHGSKCELWWDDDFRDGEVVWCPEFSTLRPAKQSYIDYQREQMDDEFDRYQSIIDARIEDSPLLDDEDGVRSSYTDDDIDQAIADARAEADDPATWSNDDGWGKVKTCKHWQTAVVLPDGTEVYCSGTQNDPEAVNYRYNKTVGSDPGVKGESVPYRYNPQVERIVPDLGVYMSGSWVPDCIAYHIGCYDFEAPNVPAPQVLFMVNQALDCAQKGMRVELGCMGGHGRTGTILAILVGLADPDLTPGQCMAYVWKNYCGHAIECREQENFITTALLQHRSTLELAVAVPSNGHGELSAANQEGSK